ncbi:hypothetical protein [Oleisolibacter albus]|uniref:hypothetical protein n=1 Tax=Oleisolibacter albus TaxID=2171757 RepID=UPI00138FDD20|nr:hypothetical protein [Oleisolibacter albus]
MFKFVKALLGANVESAVNAVVEAAVAANPQAATAAELKVLEQEVDKAAATVADFRVKLNQEKKEADAARTELDRLIAAGENLQRKLDAATDPELKAELDASLESFAARLEQANERLDREDKDVVQVEAMLAQAEDLFRQRSQALASAREQLERAARDMAAAKLDAQRAQQRSEDAARLAGLRQGATGSRLNTALGAMEKAAQDARTRAAAMDIKADALGEVRSAAQGDKHIAAALAEVQGTGSSGPSARDRIAAIAAKRK